MAKMEELREMLCEELDKITKKGELSAGSLDVVDKLTHSIKSIDTIIAMEDAGYSSDDYSMRGNSYARGRGSNARRDSMGRYSSDNYSMRGGRSGERGRNYSYDDEMNNLREQLEDMERMAKDEESKRMIRQWKMQLN
jgi:hypothetical protein